MRTGSLAGLVGEAIQYFCLFWRLKCLRISERWFNSSVVSSRRKQQLCNSSNLHYLIDIVFRNLESSLSYWITITTMSIKLTFKIAKVNDCCCFAVYIMLLLDNNNGHSPYLIIYTALYCLRIDSTHQNRGLVMCATRTGIAISVTQGISYLPI